MKINWPFCACLAVGIPLWCLGYFNSSGFERDFKAWQSSRIVRGKSYTVKRNGIGVRDLADSGEALYDIENSTRTFLDRALTKRYSVVNEGETVIVLDVNGLWVQVRVTQITKEFAESHKVWGTTDKRGPLWIQAEVIE